MDEFTSLKGFTFLDKNTRTSDEARNTSSYDVFQRTNDIYLHKSIFCLLAGLSVDITFLSPNKTSCLPKNKIMKLRNSLYLLAMSVAFIQVGNSFGQQFTKVTTGDIVNTPSGSRSCNFLDVNNDNLLDILITNGTSGGENNMLYLNNGDETFSLMSDTIVNDNTPTDGATCADFDNDGFTDVFSVNWYNVNNLAYRNNGGASFSKIDTSVISNQLGYSETASWGDCDNDGLLDLYVTNSAGLKRNFLYSNLGSVSFQAVAGITPVTDNFFSRCVNWIDYDLDGDQDIFITNEGNQQNNLYRNDGGMVFTAVVGDTIVSDNFSSMSSSWGDFDNDGDFDLFVANYEQNNQFFMNDGLGNFTAIPGPWNTDVGCSFSSSFADYDNDGDLDLFVTNGYCSNDLNNYLYINNGDGTFSKDIVEPVSTEVGGSYGCAWGDYNNDGFMDLVVANWQGEEHPNYVFRNDGNGNNWSKIKLEGTISNRSAIGAIVKCKATINGNSTWQTHLVSAQTGYCSQNSLVVHFGLGDATIIDSLQILWPSGIIQTFENVSSNQFLSLVENGDIGVLATISPSLDEKNIVISPNPSKGQFRVTSDAEDLNDIQLFTSSGRNVSEHMNILTVHPSESVIDISSLQSGFYLLKVGGKSFSIVME